MHLGHVFAANFARNHGERMLLRHEDIDPTRVRPEFYAAVEEDLAWLGLTWQGEPRLQSEHFDDYQVALDKLEREGLTYPCFCTRAVIAAEIERAGAAPHGPDGPVYPGTCRRLTSSEREALIASGRHYAVRLDVEAGTRIVGSLTWYDHELGTIEAEPTRFGDIVVARKETPASYHLCVVVDDALQGVTLVTRGNDLSTSTDVERLLQALLGIEPPKYWHHPLVLAADGRKLSKRDDDLTVRSLREAGLSPAQVTAMARP